MPGAARPVGRSRPNSSWNIDYAPVSTPPLWFRHFIQRFACARLLNPHLTGSRPVFSSTLTTPALDRCSSRWFGACSCKPAPRGQTLIFNAASNTSFGACSWHTINSNLGVVLQKMGRVGEAADVWREVVQRDARSLDHGQIADFCRIAVQLAALYRGQGEVQGLHRLLARLEEVRSGGTAVDVVSRTIEDIESYSETP